MFGVMATLLLNIARFFSVDIMKRVSRWSFFSDGTRALCISILIEKWIAKAMNAKQIERSELINLCLYDANEIYQRINSSYFDTPVFQYISPKGITEPSNETLERAIVYLSYFKEMTQDWRFRKKYIVESRIILSEFCHSLNNKAKLGHISREVKARRNENESLTV